MTHPMSCLATILYFDIFVDEFDNSARRDATNKSAILLKKRMVEIVILTYEIRSNYFQIRLHAHHAGNLVKSQMLAVPRPPSLIVIGVSVSWATSSPIKPKLELVTLKTPQKSTSCL